MNDIQKLIEALRVDAGDYAIVKTGANDPAVTYSWSLRKERAWEAADALEALNRENEELAARIEGFATWGTAAKDSSGELWDIWSSADEEDARDAKRQFDDEPDEVGSDPVVIVRRYGNGPWVEVSS